jgi:hypothetical protein
VAEATVSHLFCHGITIDKEMSIDKLTALGSDAVSIAGELDRLLVVGLQLATFQYSATKRGHSSLPTTTLVGHVRSRLTAGSDSYLWNFDD